MKIIAVYTNNNNIKSITFPRIRRIISAFSIHFAGRLFAAESSPLCEAPRICCTGKQTNKLPTICNQHRSNFYVLAIKGIRLREMTPRNVICSRRQCYTTFLIKL